MGPAMAARAAGGGVTPWLEAALVTALALGVRLAGLDHTPHTDELPPVLAARSLLASGTAAVAGVEVRGHAQLLTTMVAVLFRLGGESLAAARIPAVAGGTLLVLAAFLWVRAVLGRTAGWVAAILLGLNPVAVYWSQAVHLATWPALFAGLGAIAVYHLGCRLGSSEPLAARGRTAALAAGAAVGFGLAFLIEPGAIDFHAIDLRGGGAYGSDLGFYHRLLGADYAGLWPLLPLAWLVAFAAAPRPLAFLGLVFVVSFVSLSLAAGKDERLILYVLPAFAAILGGAAQVVLPRAAALLSGLLAGRPAGPREPGPAWAGIAAAGILVAFLFPLAASTGAFAMTWRVLTVPDAEWTDARPYRGVADWVGAARELQAVADSAQVLVGSDPLQALNAFGRVDYVLSRRALRQQDGRAPEFAPSPLVGRPMISAPESVARVMEMHARGLIVIEKAEWHAGWGVPGGTANLITAYADPVPLPGEYRILAYRWHPLAE
jgi:hypothetical protein